MLQIVRREAERRGRAIAVLLDLQGPKIRVGRFADRPASSSSPGAEFTITTDTSVIGDEKRVSTTYKLLPRDVKAGDQILLDDGYLVARGDRGRATTRCATVVVTGGVLKNNKGINLPGVEVSAPALSEKDRTDIGFALRHGVDYVALSFVRRPEDVRRGQAPAHGRPGVDPGHRQDREAAGARAARRDHRRRRRHHGRARRSRRRARPREGAARGRSASSRRPTSAARSSSPRRRCSSR